MHRYILALDPSGNFDEGKGVTGWVLFDTTQWKYIHGAVQAKDYPCNTTYWTMHTNLIDHWQSRYPDLILVIEDYLLYATAATSQINSRLETPKLIGILEYHCAQKEIPLVRQTAAQVKKRWSNKILVHKGLLEKRGNRIYNPFNGKPVNRHIQDALRHAMHFAVFYNKEC